MTQLNIKKINLKKLSLKNLNIKKLNIFNIKKLNIKKFLIMFFIFMTSNLAYSAASEWKMLSNESSITFTGTQNGAPASGSFKKFAAQIKLDPDHLDSSKVKITIDMTSVSMSYSDFTSTLLSSDWLDVKTFPQAIFETTHIAKVGNDEYNAEGNLTIRNHTSPITLTFKTQNLSANKVKVEGQATFKRTSFGVGQGEWADTDSVKDEIQVNFVVTAEKE